MSGAECLIEPTDVEERCVGQFLLGEEGCLYAVFGDGTLFFIILAYRDLL